MKHLINWVEIPINDMDRAVSFYRKVLEVEFHQMQIGEIEYALFPSEDRHNTGALAKGPGYKPSGEGIVIYLDGGKDLQSILAKVGKHGGTVIMDKTHISTEAGFIGLFVDSEGNRIGLQHM
jgi:predicted enzyme related to lactoylglutathione lyase